MKDIWNEENSLYLLSETMGELKWKMWSQQRLGKNLVSECYRWWELFSREVEVVIEKPDGGSRLIILFEDVFEQLLNLES